MAQQPPDYAYAPAPEEEEEPGFWDSFLRMNAGLGPAPVGVPADVDLAAPVAEHVQAEGGDLPAGAEDIYPDEATALAQSETGRLPVTPSGEAYRARMRANVPEAAPAAGPLLEEGVDNLRTGLAAGEAGAMLEGDAAARIELEKGSAAEKLAGEIATAEAAVEQRRAHYASIRDRIETELDDSYQAFKNSEIDSERWIRKNRTTAIISTILGGIGAGLAGGENPATRMIDKAIERDIQQQKGNRALAKGRMDQQDKNLQQSMDREEFEIFTEEKQLAFTKQRMAAELEKNAAKYKAKGKYAEVLQEIGRLRMEANQHFTNASKVASTHNMNRSQMLNEIEAMRAGGGGSPLKMSASAEEKYRGTVEFVDLLDKVEEAFDAGATDWFAAASAVFPGTGAAAYDHMIDLLADSYRLATTGQQASAEELKRIMEKFPKARKWDKEARNRFRNFRSLMAGRLRSYEGAYRDFGQDVSPITRRRLAIEQRLGAASARETLSQGLQPPGQGAPPPGSTAVPGGNGTGTW